MTTRSTTVGRIETLRFNARPSSWLMCALEIRAARENAAVYGLPQADLSDEIERIRERYGTKDTDAQEYARRRQELGSQSAVARMLGVDKITISRRERGVAGISREAWLALLALER